MMKDIEDCLERVQNKLTEQDYRMNIIIDKLNYVMFQQEQIKNDCKEKLNAIYGCKHAHFLSTAQIYNAIPYAEFDLSINNELVKRFCTWSDFFDMKEGIYNYTLDTKIDLKNALNHVVKVEVGNPRINSVNLKAIVREGEFCYGG